MWLLWLVLGALTAYLGLHYSRNNQPVAPLACSEDFKNEKDLSSLPSRNLTLPKIPRAGLAIVTSSGQGYSRDIVYKLANRGLHVLSCVKSKQEERSFAFDKHKGIEAIQASLDKPVDIARLIYRSNEIKRDLNRTLAAVVINVVGMRLLIAVICSLLLLLLLLFCCCICLLQKRMTSLYSEIRFISSWKALYFQIFFRRTRKWLSNDDAKSLSIDRSKMVWVVHSSFGCYQL